VELVEAAFVDAAVGIAARPFVVGTEAAVGVVVGIAGLPRTAGATVVVDTAETLLVVGAAPIAAPLPPATIPPPTAPRVGSVCAAGIGRAVARVTGNAGFAAIGVVDGTGLAAGLAAGITGAGLGAGFGAGVLFVVLFVVLCGVVCEAVCPHAGKELTGIRRMSVTMQIRTRLFNIEVSPYRTRCMFL
jgi:hypothetical protein